MTEPRYSVGEVAVATRLGLEEVFGEGSPTVDLLVGRALGHLSLDGSDFARPATAEEYSFDEPPRYAERALGINSPEEVAQLITEAGTRLQRSISDYLDNARYRDVEDLSLRPWIYREGTTYGDGDNLIGELFLETQPLDVTLGTQRASYPIEVASLRLRGGEDAPFNRFDDAAKETPQYEQRVTVKRRLIRDPLINAEVPLFSLEVWSGYSGGRDKDVTIHQEAGNNGPLTQAIKANVFWALDTAITYYESVYHAFNNHVGLTYADYRDAGCLGEDGKLDRHKAEAWVLSHISDATEMVGIWPVLGNYEQTLLHMDPEYRAKVAAYRSRALVSI